MKIGRHSLDHYPLLVFFFSLILLLNLIQLSAGNENNELNDLLFEEVDGHKVNVKEEFNAFKEGQQTNEKAYLHLQRVFLSILLYVRNLASKMEARPTLKSSSKSYKKTMPRTSSKYIPDEQQQGRLVSGTLATGIGEGYSALPPSAGADSSSGSSQYSVYPPPNPNSKREKRTANAEEDSKPVNEEISFGNEATKLVEELTKQSQPMLHFKIDYNYKFMDEIETLNQNRLEKFLIVKINKAINIPPMDTNGLSDPFVEVIAFPEETKEEEEEKTSSTLKDIENKKSGGGKLKAITNTINKTLEPIFNQELQIMLPPEKSVLFRIFDGNTFKKNAEIGEFIVSFEKDEEDELLLIDENNNKHSLPYEQWRKIEITTETAQNNMVKSPMIKLLHQSKIMEALIAMDSESRYKAMLDYCNNRWNILNLKTEKGSSPSPFSDFYIEDVLEIIKKGTLADNSLLDAETERIQEYSKFWSSNSEDVKDLAGLRKHWNKYEQCLEKIFNDEKEETRTLAHLEMSKLFKNLLRNLMMPQPIFLAKEVYNALENNNLHTLMEFASTLDNEDLAMTRRLVELLYGDNMDFKENTKFMGKLTNSIKNPIRHNKVLNFLYWRYHGMEKKKQKIEESYGETERKVNELVEMRQNDMLESAQPSVVYSLHKEMDNATNMVRIKFSLNRMIKLPAMDANLLSDPYVQVYLLKPEFGKEKKDKEIKEGWFTKKSSSKSSSGAGGSKLEKKDSKNEQQQPLLGSSNSSKGSFSSSRKLSHKESLMEDVFEFGNEEEESMDSSQQKEQQIYVDDALTEEKEKKLLYGKDFKPKFSKKYLGKSYLQNDTLNPIYNIHSPFEIEFKIMPQRLKFSRLLLLIYDRDGPTNRDDKITDVEIPLDPNDSDNYGNDLVKVISPMLFYQIIRRSPDHRLIDNIIILRAKNLPSTDPDGLSDPLVELKVALTSYGKTHVVNNDLNPVFDIQFDLKSIKKLDQMNVFLELWDKDKKFKMKNVVQFKLKSTEFEKIGEFPVEVLLKHATQYGHGGYMDPFTNEPFKTIKINGHDRPFYDSYGHRILVAFDPKTRIPYPFDLTAKRQVAIDYQNKQFVIVVDEQTGEPFPFDAKTKRQVIAKRNQNNPENLEAFEIEIVNENGEQKICAFHNRNNPNRKPVPIERMNPVFQHLFVNDDGHVMFSPKYIADPNYGVNYQKLFFKNREVQLALSGNLAFEIVENCPVTGHPVHEMVVPINLNKKIRDHQHNLEALMSSADMRPQLHYRMEYKDGMLTVNLKKGKNLPNKDNTGKSDPFAVLYLLPSIEKIGKTEVFHENLNPDFKWEFKLKIPKERLKTSTLVFDIIDYDATSRNDKMGIAMIQLAFSSFIDNSHQEVYKKTEDGDEIVWVELDKIGLIEWGKLLMQKHFTMIGPLEFRTYWYMAADEQLQRRYFEQLLIKSFRTQTSIGEGVQQTFGLKHSMKPKIAIENIHRVLVSRYDYDLSEIVTPQAERFSKWLDKISAETIMQKMWGITMKTLQFERVAVTRAYRMALRKLMSIENRDLVHYDKFLDHYGLFTSKFIEEMNKNNNNNDNDNDNGFTYTMSLKDSKLEMIMQSPWKLSGSDYLHKLINDLNQSVISQMDLMFRRDFRHLTKNNFKQDNLMRKELIETNFRQYSNDLSAKNEQEKLIKAYMEVLTSFVIAHNKALAIVLHCIGKPYKIIKPKTPVDDKEAPAGDDENEDNNKQKQKQTGMVEKRQMNPMQRTLAEQQQLEAQLLDVESVEGHELDPDEEERYYKDLEMAQFRIQDEHEAFGVGNTGKIGELQCPPFAIDVPEISWIEEKPYNYRYYNNEKYHEIKWNEEMRGKLAEQVGRIAKNLKDRLVHDILGKEHLLTIGSKKYKYQIGRAILRKLGFLNDQNSRNSNSDLAKGIAQKLIDDIGAMMEKKHNQLMSDSDENFVFDQVDFTPMQLSLTGDSAESKFERFLQKCFNWLNSRIQSLHSKSVKKKNRMARFLFKWIHSFTSSIRDLITGKEKKLTFLLRTFFPALYYGRKILVKLGKTLKKMASKIRKYLFTANGRREFKKDVYELMQGARETFKNDNWKLMKKFVDENAAHNLSGTDQKEKEDFKKMSQDFFQNEAKTQNNEEELFDSLGSIGKTMIGGKNNAVEGNSASGNQQYDQFDSMPPNSMDRFYTWEMELDDSVAASSQAAEYSSHLLKPRRKREILAARNQTIFNGNMENEIVRPNHFQNSTNIDTNNFRTNSLSSSNYYDQTQQYYQPMMGLRRIKRKGGFGRASVGGFGKSAVASKRAAIYYHSPSPFMPSYNPNRSTYTYVYISDNHYHDGGQCLMTSHKWMLLGVWTVGHGFFFLMVTRPVHKDMKRVNCDEKHGFKEFCKSFFNHLFFKYIKGIFTLGKAVFQRIRGQYKWRKEMNAREYKYTEGTTGSETGKFELPDDVAKPTSFATHLFGEQYSAYREHYFNDCARIYSGLLIAFQLLIWLVGIIVIIAAF